MHRFPLSLLLLLTIAAVALPAASIEGDWSGTLEAGPQTLRLVLHISAGEEGSLSGTLDSVDQGQNGLPIRSIVLEGSQLRFEMQGLPASFEGTVADDGSSIEGNWMQGGASMPLRFQPAADEKGPDQSQYPRIEGIWLGELQMPMQSIRLVLRVERENEGFRVTADSPDQGANGIPVSSLTIDGDSVEFTIGAVGASFSGTLDGEAGTISGDFEQGNETLPLVFHKTDEIPEARRPQTPEEPYPYRAEEVTFPGGVDGVVLAGTLTLPEGDPTYPGLVLVSGSGAQDRDETIMGHKPFLVLADHLTRSGIAVLRYDDRGTAASTGDYSAATISDLADDAEAALSFLISRDEIAKGRIGILGHSEGATVAAMVGARRNDIGYVILLAAPAVPGEQILLRQVEQLLELSGATPDEVELRVEQNREVYDLARQGKSLEEIRAKLSEMLPPAQVEAQMTAVISTWFRHFLVYDPATAISKLEMPLLALYGENDVQVDPLLNIPPLKKALAGAGNARAQVEELHGLNHLFQTSESGSPFEYGTIAETMSPDVLDRIADWILQTVASTNPG